MKKFYSQFYLTVSFITVLQLALNHAAKAQCPFGVTPGATAYDTTIATPSGINTLEIKFPQADPLVGMVTCLKLCVTITGVVDSISVENNSSSKEKADVFYIRTDQITGPGLSGPLFNTINHHYGTYNLFPTDGVPGSGIDFVSISHDTLLNAVSLCQTINNLDSLFQFYGHDSVSYMYNITALTSISCTGGNYNSTVATSALVNFHFEYCTCPGYILPLNIRNFDVEKVADNKAKLTWSGFDDDSPNYHYETEMSRDGSHFSSVGQVNRNPANNGSYSYLYTTAENESGTLYFRVKQVYANGYTRFSEIKKIVLNGSENPKFIIYPNPSTGIVGIKFANNQGGKMLLQIFNSNGQKVLQEEILVAGASYQQVATLKSGSYWLKLTDAASRLSNINQLIIK